MWGVDDVCARPDGMHDQALFVFSVLTVPGHHGYYYFNCFCNVLGIISYSDVLPGLLTWSLSFLFFMLFETFFCLFFTNHHRLAIGLLTMP